MKRTIDVGVKRRLLSMVFIALAGILFLTTEALANKEWIINEEALPFTPRPGATAYWGVHAEAAYRMEVPANWNGNLVLSCHGYVAATTKTLSVSTPTMRDLWLSQGFAWAASSYRANGYVPGTGALDTHRLIGLFKEKVGKPKRVYIVGTSLGGHVAGIAIEQWPKSFDGALVLCGVMGGNDLFSYFQDAYVVAETLAWGEVTTPTPYDYSVNYWPFTKAELGTAFPNGLNEKGLHYREIIKHITGGERPGFYQGFSSNLIGGAFIFNLGSAAIYGQNNTDTLYRWSPYDADLSDEELEFNETIWRSYGLPKFQKKNGLGVWPGTEAVTPPINGTFSVPVVSLHTLGDMFVPFSMEQSYARRAAENGNDDLLAIRAIRGCSHCDFNTAEVVQAWYDLVLWVEAGIPAAGDEVLDPDVVDDPNYGCQFSTNSALRTMQGMTCP